MVVRVVGAVLSPTPSRLSLTRTESKKTIGFLPSNKIPEIGALFLLKFTPSNQISATVLCSNLIGWRVPLVFLYPIRCPVQPPGLLHRPVFNKKGSYQTHHRTEKTGLRLWEGPGQRSTHFRQVSQLYSYVQAGRQMSPQAQTNAAVMGANPHCPKNNLSIRMRTEAVMAGGDARVRVHVRLLFTYVWTSNQTYISRCICSSHYMLGFYV